MTRPVDDAGHNAFRGVVFGMAALVVLCSGTRPATVIWQPSGPQASYAYTHVTQGGAP